MKERFKFSLSIFIGLILCISIFGFVSKKAFATTKDGTIDPVFKYAKLIEKNRAKINFSMFTKGSAVVHVTDLALTGFAWGENVGLINLAPKNGGVRNDGEGKLFGYATSEFGGWINFSGVLIDKEGNFNGYAQSKDFGKIIFNCDTDNSCATDNFKVNTDWRPVSVRNDGTILPPLEPFEDIPPADITSIKNTTDEDTDTKPVVLVDDGKRIEDDGTKKEETEIIKKIIVDVNTNKISGIVDQKINEPQKEIPKIPVVYVSQENSSSIPSFVKKTTDEIKKDAAIITTDPVVNISTKTITTAGVASGGTVIVSSLVNSLFSFSEFFLIIFRLWSIIMSALGLRKKSESWGTVYDSVTKQPLDPAYVVLKDKFGKVIATSITDMNGRYGFLAKPGIYHIVAKKTNYINPSVKLRGKTSDEFYDNLYFGEDIQIGNESVVNKNIPMDPEKFDWNEFAKRKDKLVSLKSPLLKAFFRISNALFVLGFIFAVGLLIVKPDIFNVLILSTYIILFILRKANKKTKSYGIIFDKNTGMPIPFAVVRVFLKGVEGKEIFHRVADEFGKYYCLLPKKGEYHINIDKKNEDGSYTKLFSSGILDTKKGILKEDFSI